MKNLILILSSALCVFSSNISEAQTNHPLYDYAERQLTSTDTIPDFTEKTQKLKVSGIVYEEDGVTPAKDVILYFEQADEDGDFDLRKTNDERYVHHRSWVKTDADGRYTLYTFIPGNDRRYNRLQEIHPSVMRPDSEPEDIASFVFDDDPLLNKRCRKRMAKHGDVSRILKPKMVDGILVAQRDIVLNGSSK